MELVVFLCAGRNMPSRPCGICSGSLHDYWHAPLAALGRSQFRLDVQCTSVDGVVHEEKSPLVECAPHVRWQDEARSDETDTAGEGWPLQLLVCPVPRAGVTLSLSLVQCSKDAAVQEEPLGVGSFSFEVPSALLQGSAECDGMRQRKCVELSVPKGGGREGGVAGSKQGKEEYAGGCGWKQGLQPPQPDDLVVGLDGKCPTTIDLWLVWRFPGTVGRVLKDVPLVRPDENVAWGALARRRPRRNQHTSLVRATLPPFPAGTKNAKAWGEEEEEAVLQIFGGAGMLGSSRTRSQKGSGEQSSLQAVDHLSYVDAPVWRRRNGEVLVGRDVLPHVGMRVNISRQVRSLSLFFFGMMSDGTQAEAAAATPTPLPIPLESPDT